MKIDKRLSLPLVVPALAFPVAAAVGSSQTAHTAATHVVKLQQVAIHPTTLRIRSGERVTWEFLDASIMAEHTVTSYAHKGGLRFKSKSATLSGSYSVKFTKRGTYYYECTIHPGMLGKIVVR